VASLLLLAPLSGCLEPIGEATQDVVTDGSPTTEEADADVADTEPADEVEVTEVEQAVGSSFVEVDQAQEEIPRRSASITMEPLDGEGTFHMGVLFDPVDRTAIVSFEGLSQIQPSEPATSQSLMGDMDGILFGQIHQTTFVGTPSSAITVYNESADWNESASNLTDLEDEMSLTSSSSSTSDSLSPQQLAHNLTGELEDLPGEATVSDRTITYQGDPAREIHVQHDNATTSLDLRFVLAQDTERLLAMNGTVEEADGEPPFDDGARIDATFGYEDEVHHRYEEDLHRLASMAILTPEDTEGTLASPSYEVNDTRTRTVQPSHDPGLVSLEEAEVHLLDNRPRTEDPVLALPAETGATTTADAKLVYEDVDGDGHVSPGDEIRFTALSEDATGWTIAMHDEQTGMRTMVPAPSLAAVALLLAGVALLHRRRGGG